MIYFLVPVPSQAPSCSYSYSVEYKSSEAPFFQVKVAYLSWFGIQSSWKQTIARWKSQMKGKEC